MPIYMKYDNAAQLKGTVDEANYKGKGWIKFDSFTFSVSRDISVTSGGGKMRESRAPSISDVHLTKEWDEATSLQMLGKAINEKEGKRVDVHITKTGGKDGVETYLELVMSGAIFSNYSISSTGGAPHESISLNYTKIEATAKVYDRDNKLTTQHAVGYDIQENRQTA
jgi:type VI secretion system secreted protein Hcp